jgi:hypothetical protein
MQIDESNEQWEKPWPGRHETTEPVSNLKIEIVALPAKQ